MKKYLSSWFFLFCYIVVSGQDWRIVDEFNVIKARMNNEPYSRTDVYNNAEGSPFLNSEFVPGSLITKDSLMYRNVPLRYNVFRDEMEFLIGADENRRVIGDPRNFLFFILGDKTFTYHTFIDNNRPAHGYFEVLNKGNCQVLKKKQVVYLEPEAPKGYSEARPPRFEEKNDKYFLKFDMQLPREVRLRRRNVLEAFANKSNEIAGFVNDKKLSYNNPGDLVKMAEYYNQISGE
jgi:hypothetical protein